VETSEGGERRRDGEGWVEGGWGAGSRCGDGDGDGDGGIEGACVGKGDNGDRGIVLVKDIVGVSLLG
jgi:hypothetical protein